VSAPRPRSVDGVRAVSLRIDSRLELVELVTASVRAMCVTAGLPERAGAQVALAVDEALNNVIRHAYRGEAGHPVDVAFTLEPGRFTVEIGDDGGAMPSGGSSTLDFDPDDLAGLPEGGMGLHIIRGVMDEVAYRRVGGRNTLRLSRRLAA